MVALASPPPPQLIGSPSSAGGTRWAQTHFHRATASSERLNHVESFEVSGLMQNFLALKQFGEEYVVLAMSQLHANSHSRVFPQRPPSVPRGRLEFRVPAPAF